MRFSALFALFNRSLRQGVRAKSTYWGRAGLVAVVLWLMYITHETSRWAGAPGLQFFSAVLYANLFFISLGGLSYFASAITEEKEEMTLGLLQMTNLNALSILLGKSTSRLFGALLMLAAQFPFTLLAVSLGGISIGQIVAAYFVLGAFLVMLCNMALLSSVMAARTAMAAVLTGVWVGLFFFGPVLISAAYFLGHWLLGQPEIGTDRGLGAFIGSWRELNPVTRLEEVMATGFTGSPWCWQVAGTLGIGAAFFLLAWAVFPWFCRDQKDAAPPRGLLFKRNSRLRLLGPGRPWSQALLWKDFYFLSGGKMSVITRLLLYPGLIAAVLWVESEFDQPFSWDNLGAMAMSVGGIALLVELVLLAGLVFRQERRWKTLSSLAMLPLSVQRMAYQKVLGCLLACWPSVLLVVAGFLCVFPTFYEWLVKELFAAGDHTYGHRSQEFFYGGCFIVTAGAMVLTFLHLIVYLSLRLKWGALPASIAIMGIGMFITSAMMAMMFREGTMVMLPCALLVVCGVLHRRIGQRLQDLVTED